MQEALDNDVDNAMVELGEMFPVFFKANKHWDFQMVLVVMYH